MYACLAVTCHLHFLAEWPGFFTCCCGNWNGYRNKSQHRKSTLEKKILPPFQQGFEPATFQSRVRCSNHWAIPAPKSIHMLCWRSIIIYGVKYTHTHTHTHTHTQRIYNETLYNPNPTTVVTLLLSPLTVRLKKSFSLSIMPIEEWKIPPTHTPSHTPIHACTRLHTSCIFPHLNQWVRNVIVDGLSGGVCVVGTIKGEHFGRGFGVIWILDSAAPFGRVHCDATLAVQPFFSGVHGPTPHNYFYTLRHGVCLAERKQCKQTLFLNQQQIYIFLVSL